MLETISTFILTIVAAFIASVLHDRFKRPIPLYSFNFEKEVAYQSTRRGTSLLDFMVETEYLTNYVCLKNYGAMALSNVSTEIHFDKKKERLHYQTIGATEGVFDLEIEYLPTPLPQIPDLFANRDEVIEERTETGFFIHDSDMEKLKSLKSIKVKVKYQWNGKEDSDIWLFEFLDENQVRFRRLRPGLWKRIILFFKRRFL